MLFPLVNADGKSMLDSHVITHVILGLFMPLIPKEVHPITDISRRFMVEASV